MNKIQKLYIDIASLWKLLLLTLLFTIGVQTVLTAHSVAAIGIFSTCDCENELGQDVECGDNAVAVRCDINDNSWLPFELSTLRVETNNLLSENGSTKKIDFRTSPVIIEAWGAKGGTGANKKTCNKGSRGGRGYGRTTLSYIDLAATGLFMYLGKKGDSGGNNTTQGGKGGASTIVMAKQLQTVPDPCDFSLGCTPESQRIFIMAGGGGGGGGCNNDCNINGRDGGNGACAIAVAGDAEGVEGPRDSCLDHIGTFGESISAAGSDGSNQSNNEGTGGNQDLDGSGSICRTDPANSRNGKTGIGGRGGARDKNGEGYETWEKPIDVDGSTTDLDERVLAWTQGEGGTGDSDRSGAGGGGFGGACGGQTKNKKCGLGPGAATFSQGGGGGGGGTFVIGATESEEGFALAYRIIDAGVNNGQVAFIIGLVDTGASSSGQVLIDAVDAFGEARGLGSADGTVEITSAYRMDNKIIDLDQTEITIEAGLLEESGDLIPSIAGMTLNQIDETAEAGSRALFGSGAVSPDVTVELDDTDGVLTMDFRADNVEILESLTCRDEDQTPIEFFMTLNDGVNEPLVLEVLGHWDCLEGENGGVDILALNSEELERDTETSTAGGGNCALAGDAGSYSPALIILLLPIALTIFRRFYRKLKDDN